MKELRADDRGRHQGRAGGALHEGDPQAIMCGNSYRALTALHAAGAPVTTVDILPDPRIREALGALRLADDPAGLRQGEPSAARTSPRSCSSRATSSGLDETLGAERGQEIRTVALELA